METVKQQPRFDAPIPGQNFTAEVGSRPWQTPAQYTTLEEVSEYYISRMSTDEVANEVINALEQDVSVAELAHVLQLSNVMSGVHNIDVGVLVTPILMEFIMLIADSVGLEYDTGLEDKEFAKKDAIVQSAMKKFKEEQTSEESKNSVDTDVKSEEEEKKLDNMSAIKGLMARSK